MRRPVYWILALVLAAGTGCNIFGDHDRGTITPNPNAAYCDYCRDNAPSTELRVGFWNMRSASATRPARTRSPSSTSPPASSARRSSKHSRETRSPFASREPRRSSPRKPASRRATCTRTRMASRSPRTITRPLRRSLVTSVSSPEGGPGPAASATSAGRDGARPSDGLSSNSGYLCGRPVSGAQGNSAVFVRNSRCFQDAIGVAFQTFLWHGSGGVVGGT